MGRTVCCIDGAARNAEVAMRDSLRLHVYRYL
jgi:hypothetical protein